MFSKNGSLSNENVFEEMEKIIDEKYLHLMRKRVALAEAKIKKHPDVEDRMLEIEQLQEDFEGITKTHNTYLRHKKLSGKKGVSEKGTLEEFNKMMQEMKSKSMGSIVAPVPKA